MASACFGEFETSAVLGTVADPRGGMIQRAKVSLEKIDTGTAQSTLTDANGSREVCGDHDHSDTRASRALSAAVGVLLLNNAALKPLIDAARAELRAARVTSE